MSYRQTMEAALENLHEIEDLLSGFSERGAIPSIEIDLALQKLRNLYELMLMIKDKDKDSETEAVSKKNIGEMHTETTEPARNISSEASEKKHAEPDKISEKTGKDTSQYQEVEDKKVIASVKHKATEIHTLADQFKGQTTLHESLHQNLNKDEALLVHTKPITDLYTGIGVNDRFTFIRELFNNDKNAYEHTITILNDAASFNDAYNYIIRNFDWDMDSEAIQLLLDIIRRKFIKGRNE